MKEFVPIEPGQWVLAYVEHYYPGYVDGDMAGALEQLVTGGSGWILHRASDQFEVMQATKVMPKTFRTAENGNRHRSLVVAAGAADEMVALRDRLFSVGFAADQKIEEETARRMADFERSIRAEALSVIHAALPHIFEVPGDAT